MTYGIQAWGNSTSITQLGVLQKRVIRIINKKRYRSHTDPIFKSESILKISDLYKLHVSLFMFDLQNGSLGVIHNCHHFHERTQRTLGGGGQERPYAFLNDVF